MKKAILPLALLFLCTLNFAQTNVRAWYADGQVWVVWDAAAPLPETFAIYAKPTPFTQTTDAVLLGRLFKEEYGPYTLREQVDTAATYRIPNGNGGTYQLADNEALFVATPHQAGALYFAVVPWGQTAVSAGVNVTASAVLFQYNPTADPVECHLQKSFVSPFDHDYICFAFCMWADGRQNQWENRPDFPVMANAAKNGMPSLFMISVPMDLDTTQPMPLTVWLHGGGGTARQSLAGSRQDINLNPAKGLLLAHNDDLFGYLGTFYQGTESVSRHLGWRKNYDPFTGEPPTEVDTIINYTQRRYYWIDKWLMRHYNIDSTRINMNGHSMGSRGATMMAKIFPEHYATVTILNNGFEDDDPAGLNDVPFGSSEADFPTNITGYYGETIHFAHMMDLNTRLSAYRDFPLMRSFHGKNDQGGGNQWDQNVVEQYRIADSLAWGAQLYWSEREHGADTGPANNDHWISGLTPTQQTVVDDIAYEESVFRSDVSYPAFFNHRLDQKNNDPGDGTPGTGANGVGDDWGAWGGYHRWDWDHIIDVPIGWSALAWLEGNAIYANDNCPNDFLTADMAIRKPRKFLPATGTTIYWRVRDAATNQVLQSGSTQVQADNLVVIPQVRVFKETIGRVRIDVSTQASPTTEAVATSADIHLFPNPGTIAPSLAFEAPDAGIARVRVCSAGATQAVFDRAVVFGQNLLILNELSDFPSGVYFISLELAGGVSTVCWMKN